MKELELKFTGRGETKGFNFTQLKKSPKSYLYEVETDGNIYYEVFERREYFKYDFETKQKTKEIYVRYPNSSVFGVWAWTFKDFNQSLVCYHRLENKVLKTNKLKI